MKRLVTVLLALVLVLTMAPAVRADLIYIPQSDFLDAHWQECEEIRRVYIARTDVTAYENPENGLEEGVLPQGEPVELFYVWTDAQGMEWGYMEYYKENVSVFGWIPMCFMALRYDYISFEEDYGDQFHKLDVYQYLDESCLGQEIWFWAYPGSDRGYSIQLAEDEEYLPDYNLFYNDEQGRKWIYIGYYMGFRNYWICASDPTADFATLYPEGSPEVEITEPLPPLPAQEIKPGAFLIQNADDKPGFPAAPVILGGVVLCAVITAAVLLKKKKKGDAK